MQYTIHPQLPAIDIGRARQWYREKLGLEPVPVNGRPVGPDDDDLLFDTGTAQFGVYQSAHAGKNLATAARLVTADFDAVHAELLANGVEFEVYAIEGNFSSDDDDGPQPYFDGTVLVSEDGEKTAWFKDSEGNILAIGSSH